MSSVFILANDHNHTHSAIALRKTFAFVTLFGMLGITFVLLAAGEFSAMAKCVPFPPSYSL